MEATVPLELFNYIIFPYDFSRRPCHSKQLVSNPVNGEYDKLGGVVVHTTQ